MFPVGNVTYSVNRPSYSVNTVYFMQTRSPFYCSYYVAEASDDVSFVHVCCVPVLVSVRARNVEMLLPSFRLISV
jgi:hypothetical protein